RDDIVGAARAWVALVATSPADADRHRALILAPVREKLLGSTVAALRKKYEGAKYPLSADEAKRIRETIADLRELAAKIDISTASGSGAEAKSAFAEIEAGLADMRRADEALSECTIVYPVWTADNTTEISFTKAADLGEAPGLTEIS